MTWQDPGGNRTPGDPSLDETRTDWSAPEPAPGGEAPPAAPPAPPTAPPPWSAPGPGPAPGYAPGYPPATAPGMTWAPPPSDTSYAVPGVSGLRFADVGPRLVAWIIDILILGLIGSGVSLAMSAVFGTTVDWTAMLTNPEAAFEGDMYTRMVLVTFIGTLIATAIDFTYFVVLWSSEGRATLGMRLLKLQVGNAADGRTLTRPQAFKRWLVMGNWLDLLSALPLVGGLIAVGQLAWYVVLLITTANSPTRQGLHDRSAGTAIVQPSGGSGNGMLMGCVVIIGILVVMSLVSMVALVFLGSQVSTILEEVGNSI